VHHNSHRASRNFIKVNCAALQENLLESELFGHEKGAFTGADRQRIGRFEMAHNGTIFLDEIGELPMPVQAKLLRVLETGDVQRIGTMEPKRVDVHILAATNRDLNAEVAAGRFRADLLYRLNVVEVQVPALRERKEDIPYLVAAFVRECSQRLGKKLSGLSPSAERALMASNWPGNVRELRNVIERACILADGELVTERELVQSKPAPPPAVVSTPLPSAAPASTDANEGSLSLLEKEHIIRVMESVNGNKVSAAKILGLDRRALYRRLERYGIGSIERRGKVKD
jgi:two-component system, NtrC family, response regulator HydG